MWDIRALVIESYVNSEGERRGLRCQRSEWRTDPGESRCGHETARREEAERKGRLPETIPESIKPFCSYSVLELI